MCYDIWDNSIIVIILIYISYYLDYFFMEIIS